MGFPAAGAAVAVISVIAISGSDARAGDCANVYPSRVAAMGPDVPRDWHYSAQGLANYLFDTYDVTGSFTLTGLGVSYDPLKWGFEAVGRGLSATLGGAEYDTAHQIATFEYSQASTGSNTGYCEISDEFNTGHVSVYSCYVAGPDGSWVTAGGPSSPLRERARYMRDCSLTAFSYEPGRSPAIHDRSALHPPLASGVRGPVGPRVPGSAGAPVNSGI